MSLATRIAQEFNNVRSHISGITATHLLGGNLSVSNEVITNGFSTTLYTGNGGTQSVTTGIDMATQYGDDASEMFGGLSWVKSRNIANGHQLYDTVRGATKVIYSQLNNAEATEVTGITSFNNKGFTIGSLAGVNQNASTQVSWNFQTTHRRTGITNHGKAFTEHYNPFTGFTIIKYEGSGLAGHEIPHSLGRKLGLSHIKNLSAVANWVSPLPIVGLSTSIQLNLTVAQYVDATVWTKNTEESMALGTVSAVNATTNQYIMYGWANSYYDEADKLIGNYEIGVYQGTGVAGNKVTTRGKPAWIMIKRLDSAASWGISDNIRNTTDPRNLRIVVNTSTSEYTGTAYNKTFNNGDFTINGTDADENASGGQYLYMIVYDNDAGSGKSKYPKATDTSNVQINNALIPLAHGIDSNGSKNSIVVANETITGLTYTQGKNYLYKTDTGYGVKPYEQRMLSSELVRIFAGEQPDYFDVNNNKWFNTDAGSELVTNGTFSSGVTTGWTAQDGAVLSIDNGTLKVLNGIATAGSAYQLISGLTVGKKYKIKAKDVGGNANYSSVYIAYVSPIVANLLIIGSSGGVMDNYTIDTEFIAQATSVYIVLRNDTTTINLYNNFDDISVFEADIVPTTEITESRNYLNHIVHADQNGQVAYVEELPKIEYKDIIKANEYQGKNATSLSIAFDLTTTPITVIGALIGVRSIVRTSTGIADLYLNDNIKGTKLKLNGLTNGNQVRIISITDSKITIETSNSSGTATSYTYTSINGVGE